MTATSAFEEIERENDTTDEAEETEPQRVERLYGSILDPFRQKYGTKGIAYWEIEEGKLFVIRKPSKAQQHKYVNELQKDGLDKALLAEQYALACVVHPVKTEAQKIFDELPVFSITVNARAQELAGAGVRELGKD